MHTNKAILSIQKINLEVKIGATAEERQLPQLLEVDVIINYQSLPKLALTDKLADGVCYATLLKKVKEFSISREFNLIEHFTYTLANFIQNSYALESLHLKVYKRPKIEGETQMVIFEYILQNMI